MAWPNRVYVATRTLGIYYASPFTATGDQPVWGTVNGGLAATTIGSFCLDTHEAAPDSRMFCIVSGTLYRRTIGDWASVLTTAAALTLAGYSAGPTLQSVIVDSVTGYVYALLAQENETAPIGVMISTDHGDNWSAVTVRASAFNYNVSNIDAYNGLVVFTTVPAPALVYIAYHSVNHGGAWAYHIIDEGSSAASLPVRIHRGLTQTWYGTFPASANYFDLFKATPAGYTALSSTEGYGPYTAGGIWMDPDTAAHMLVLNDSLDTYARETSDDWASTDAENATSVTDINEIAEQSQNDAWVMGSVQATGAALLYVTTNGYTVTHRSGANYNNSPYADSIPDTAGGVTPRGIWAVFDVASEGPTAPPGSTITPPDTGTPITLGGTAYVQAVTMPDYTGDDRGEPLPGDRGAWDVSTESRADLHASDIAHDIMLYHLPRYAATPGVAPIWSGSQWEPVDVTTEAELAAHTADASAHHAPVTLGAGSDAALGLVGQELTLADVLTPAEHTAIGNGAPHHAAVTLGAGNDAALAMVGQELTLTMPAAGGTTYRQFTYVDNGDSTWSFVTNGDGMPVFANLDTE
jgi:hypothetical protein